MPALRDTLSVDGRRASVLRQPSGGPPLVLVHGAGANAAVWSPVLPHLDAFECWAVSLPGRDGSDGPPLDSVSALARWLEGVLQAGGLSEPIVLGHSLGGAIAQELVHRGAEVAGLALVATGARLRVHPSILEGARAATAGGPRVPSRLGFPDDAPAGVVRAYEEACHATPPEATLADWLACDGFDRLAEVGDLATPTLIVHGNEDALTPPKFQRFFEEQLPRGARVELEGAGHMLPWERPEDLARTVRTWAAGIG